MPKVLALTKDGKLTYCSAPENKRGQGRCNHIGHQKKGQSEKEFLEEMNYNPARDNPMIKKEYNQKGFEEAEAQIRMYNKTCIRQATSLGKSSIMCRIADEHRDKSVLFVTPSSNLVNDMEGYKFAINCKEKAIVTYSRYCKMTPEELSKFDMIFLDEVHHVGKDENVCFKQLEIMQNMNKDLIVVGSSATTRRLDGGDPVYSIFDGHTASNLTLSDAYEKKYLAIPRVVNLCDYESTREEMLYYIDEGKKRGLKESNYIQYCKDYEEAAKSTNNDKVIEDEVTNKIQANIKANEPTKVLIYCEDIADIDAKKEKYDDIIKSAASKCGKEVNSEPFHSKVKIKGGKDNLETFVSDNDKVQVLYLVNKLGEGAHIDGVNIEIQTRKTKSSILYNQSVGRILNRNFDNPPLLIDCVGNTDRFSEYDYEEKNRKNYYCPDNGKGKKALLGCKWMSARWVSTYNGENVSYEEVYDIFEKKGYTLSTRDKSYIKQLCKEQMSVERMFNQSYFYCRY